ANIGATVMGRNMFGGHPGPWKTKEPWNGWWGVNPPFHHPVFVLTHHAREPLRLEGGTTFNFVTGGIQSALEQARRAAAGKDVSLAGGANVANRYLAAGVVDEMEINLVPVLLGSGERLFEVLGGEVEHGEGGRSVVRLRIDHDVQAAGEVQLHEALHPRHVGDIDSQGLRVEFPRRFEIAYRETAERLAVLEHERLLRCRKVRTLTDLDCGNRPVNCPWRRLAAVLRLLVCAVLLPVSAP